MTAGPNRKRAPAGASQSHTLLRHRAANYALSHYKHFVASLRRVLATPLQSLMTILVIAIAMALPAALYVAVNNVERLGSGIEVSARMSVFIKQGATKDQIRVLMEGLEGRADIETTEFVSADQALAEFRQSSGFGDVLNLLEANPLPASIQVIPAQALITDQTALRALAGWLEQQPIVDDISMDLGWLQKLHAFVTVGRQSAFGLGVALAIGVLLVMGNTIRLAIENRRDEIVVVKLIGGTDGYVRRPFLYSGLWYGLLAGMVAWLLVWLGFLSLDSTVAQLSILYQSDYVLAGPGFTEFLALTGLGAILGLAGSWVAVYAHMRTVEPQ